MSINTPQTPQHIPVLLTLLLDIFAGKSIRCFVDGTLGAGGHAKAILEAHPEIVRYIGIDRDPAARKLARENLAPFADKLSIFSGNYSEIDTVLAAEHISNVQGILMDLGVSSMQLDDQSRGFSFRSNAPLDMRMNNEEGATAADLLQRLSEKELTRIFQDFGELPRAHKIAKAIVQGRKKKRISYVEDLEKLLAGLLPRKKKIHPLTQLFQALRIAVNEELLHLQSALPKAIDALEAGGILAVISFHSLEDRIVKNIFRDYANRKPKQARLLTKKPLTASLEEIRKNPRARSAKLRCIEK